MIDFLLPAVGLHSVDQLGVVVEQGGDNGEFDLNRHSRPEVVRVTKKFRKKIIVSVIFLW